MERQLLGSIMLDPGKLEELSGIVGRDSFYDDRHRRLFEHLENMPAEVAHDVSLITRWLASVADLEACGGVDYLMEVAQSVPYAANAVYYAEIVADLAVKRRIREQAEGLLQLAMNPSMSADDLRMEVATMAEATPTPDNLILSPISAADLDAAKHNQKFIFQNILAELTPTLFVGAPKSLKTIIAIETAISAATETRAFNHFDVYEKRNVLYLCGEGGYATQQDYARRVATSKGLQLADIEGLWFCDTVPQFTNESHLLELSRLIPRRKIKMVYIDPVYLAIITERESSIFAQGPLLRRVNEVIIGEGATPILLHHTKKSVADPYCPGELSDSSFSGFAEYAGQWWIITKREKYNPDQAGSHKLWLSIGGRLGHGGLWALDIEEGSRSDPGGRRWEVAVKKPDDICQEVQNQQTAVKEKKHREALERDAEKVAQAMANYPQGETPNIIRERCGLSGTRFNIAVAELLNTCRAKQIEIEKPNRKTPYPGYKLAE